MRPSIVLAIMLALAPTPASALVIVHVNTRLDFTDPDPGDGVCGCAGERVRHEVHACASCAWRRSLILAESGDRELSELRRADGASRHTSLLALRSLRQPRLSRGGGGRPAPDGATGP